MDVTTTVTNYLAGYNLPYNRSGISFLVKSESGYYFPCFSAFVHWDNNKPYISFAKGIYSDYANLDAGIQCTKIDVQTEEPECNVLNNYLYPNRPFTDFWRPDELR